MQRRRVGAPPSGGAAAAATLSVQLTELKQLIEQQRANPNPAVVAAMAIVAVLLFRWLFF